MSIMLKEDIAALKEDIANLEARLSRIEATLRRIERLQWVMLAGLVALLARDFGVF